MSRTVLVRNRQRTRPIDAGLLKTIGRTLLVELLNVTSFELAVYIVGTREMSRLNETFLRHQGTTDVLSFDYRDCPQRRMLVGEIFLSADEALMQAARFHTTWQSEVVRYVVHGILHLVGYDDHTPSQRREMKREENRLMRELSSRFVLRRIGRARKKT